MTTSWGDTPGLIHLLSHALEGIESCEMPLRDAEDSGDEVLAELLRDYKEHQEQLAERAWRLLSARVRLHGAHATPGAMTSAQIPSGGRRGDDLVDEQSKESFPASDAPSNY